MHRGNLNPNSAASLPVAWLATLLLGMALTVACQRPELVTIGFIGGLSGRVADLGLAGRDGVMLAIEEQNQAGGIDGRQIRLLVRDDRQNPKAATRATEELVRGGAAAIIGPMTSAMAMAAVPVANRLHTLLLSPTVSTNELSGIDDHFFRLYPPSARVAEQLAGQVFEKAGLRRIRVLYDLSNRAHTESWYKHFRSSFEARGGIIVATDTFTSSPQVIFSQLAARIASQPGDGLLVLANAMDTALLVQQLHKRNGNLPVFTSEWSATEELLQFGGKAVEGIAFFHTFDQNHASPTYQAFSRRFRQRFGYAPGFASTHSYDAARVLLSGLDQNPDPNQLRKTLAEIGTFEGLQGAISIDRFGDGRREYVLMTIRNGRFEVVE